jgi:hypothetical protein
VTLATRAARARQAISPTSRAADVAVRPSTATISATTA